MVAGDQVCCLSPDRFCRGVSNKREHMAVGNRLRPRRRQTHVDWPFRLIPVGWSLPPNPARPSRARCVPVDLGTRKTNAPDIAYRRVSCRTRLQTCLSGPFSPAGCSLALTEAPRAAYIAVVRVSIQRHSLQGEVEHSACVASGGHVSRGAAARGRRAAVICALCTSAALTPGGETHPTHVFS
ncbi:hypothetical protein QF002_007253 [Paraburkholderia youngii]